MQLAILKFSDYLYRDAPLMLLFLTAVFQIVIFICWFMWFGPKRWKGLGIAGTCFLVLACISNDASLIFNLTATKGNEFGTGFASAILFGPPIVIGIIGFIVICVIGVVRDISRRGKNLK